MYRRRVFDFVVSREIDTGVPLPGARRFQSIIESVANGLHLVLPQSARGNFVRVDEAVMLLRCDFEVVALLEKFE